MQDNEKLVERLRERHAANVAGTGNFPMSIVLDAATTIEAQAREIAELRANEKYTDGQVRQWRRIANAMGYEPDVVTAKDEKPLPNWLLVRIAMFRQRVIDEATQSITAERDQARAEVEKLRNDIQAMLVVHANDKAERELHERAYESCANDLEYCRAERDALRTQLAETQARLAEAVGLLAEVFADNGKLNSLAWMDATAGVIAKQEGA